MDRIFKWINENRRELVMAIAFFGVFFVFEAYQQLFYSRNFSTGNGAIVTIAEIVNSHITRWGIWTVFSLIIVFYTVKNPLKKDAYGYLDLTKYLGIILVVLLLNLSTVSLLSLWRNELPFTVPAFTETFVFYFFHKSPLYLITLVGLIVLVHFFMNREALQLTIGELGKLKFSNEQLYEELKNNAVRDESFVLQVKTGSRTRLVPVEDIVWVEADDYCVRIHDKNEQSHTLRSSMKALDEKLSHYGFVRVHRKAIVNMSFVTEFVQNGKVEVILKNGQTVPVAQSKLSLLKSSLQQI